MPSRSGTVIPIAARVDWSRCRPRPGWPVEPPHQPLTRRNGRSPAVAPRPVPRRGTRRVKGQRADDILEPVAGVVLGLPGVLGGGLRGGVGRVVGRPGRGGGVEVHHVTGHEPQVGQVVVDVHDEVVLPGVELGVAGGDVIGHFEHTLS